MTYLKIAGVDVSEYIKTLTITHEPVWSTNAGRTLTASFVGDIVARKWKIQAQTKVLSQKDNAKIVNLLESAPFFVVGFIPTNSTDDKIKEVVMYTSTPTNQLYSYANGLPRYNGLSFNLVEQ